VREPFGRNALYSTLFDPDLVKSHYYGFANRYCGSTILTCWI
jgi:hypothetical protein